MATRTFPRASFALLRMCSMKSYPGDYMYGLLAEEMCWFSKNLRDPFDYRLRSAWRARRAICWFRDTAYEHLARARALVAILESRDILMRTIKSHRTGYVLYEDEVQVLAQPFADMRRLL